MSVMVGHLTDQMQEMLLKDDRIAKDPSAYKECAQSELEFVDFSEDLF